MLFALTRSNLLRQLPDGNGIILRLIEIVTVSNSNGTNFLGTAIPLAPSALLAVDIAAKGLFCFFSLLRHVIIQLIGNIVFVDVGNIVYRFLSDHFRCDIFYVKKPPQRPAPRPLGSCSLATSGAMSTNPRPSANRWLIPEAAESKAV